MANSSKASQNPDTSTTETTEDPDHDKYWGQPHIDGEYFSIREFEADFVKVYVEEPFLGGISLEITKYPDPSCSTAYVGFNKETQELMMGYNPYFFRSLPSAHRRGVVIHELFHVALQHLFDRNVTDKKYAGIHNICSDLALNCFIKPELLPEFALVPGKVPSMCKDPKLTEFITSVKPLQATEAYFELLKSLVDELMANGEGEMPQWTLDDHSRWEDLPGDIRDQIKDKVRNMIERSVNRADSRNNWGSIPEEMQAAIRKALQNEVDWRSVLRLFFGIARSMERISTIKKVSKKMPGILPGVKRGRIAKFLFVIDQSGSMSDEDVGLAFSEVASASKETEIDVYNFDTEVDESSHKVWKRGKEFPWMRTRCGGTDFDCVRRFINKPQNRGKWTGVCILTDMYAPKMGAIMGAKVLWVVTPTGDPQYDAANPGDLIVHLRKEEAKLQRK